MEIRLLQKHEIPMAKELWRYAFDKDEPFYSWYFREVFKPENCMGAFIDGYLASCLQIPPYSLYINGSSYDVPYVVGVVTAPEYRNRGIMKSLIKKTIEEIHSRNQYISILMPFDTFFYRPYGWELCYSQLSYEIPIRILKSYGSREGTFKKSDWEKDISSLDKIYRAYLKNHNGYVLRSEKNWEILLKDLYYYGGYTSLLQDDAGEPLGYIQYLLKGEKLIVKEIAYTNQWAKKAIFGFIYSHYSQVTHVQWPAPTNDTAFLFLRDTIKPLPTNTVTLRPFMCSRIVDVSKVFEYSCYPEAVNVSFSMKIEDTYAPWNNTNFHVVIKDGKATAIEDTNLAIDLECSINTLTQLFMGALDMNEAMDSELVVLNTPSKFGELSNVFVKKDNFINEYY